MATPEQLEAALRRADAAGDAAAARILAGELRRVRGGGAPAAPVGLSREERIAAQREADRKLYDPTAGQSFGENLLQGVGSGMTSVIRAVGGGRLARAMGLPDTAEGAEQLDAPLRDTAGGAIGRVVGQAAPAALAIPFTPAALPGALAAGAATGAALTEGDLGDRALGAAGGAAGAGVAAAVMPAARAVRGLWRGATEPLTRGGRDRIAGRAIERFGTQGGDALDNLAAARSATGARPTLAEATRDPGIARLQRAIATLDPEAAAMLGARQTENNAARVATLQALAGEGEAPVQSSVRALRRIQQGPTRAQAEGTRSAAARESYGTAFDEGIDPELAAMMKPQVDALLSRPSIQQSVATARNLAAEEGISIAEPGSVQGLHYMKQALDDAAAMAQRSGDANRARLVAQTSRDLSSVLDEIAPTYQAARAEFRRNSVPLNRQDVAARLADRAGSALRDFDGNPRLRANQFAGMLNDEARLIEQATGFGGAGNALDDLLTPTQSGRIRAVRDELETLANLDRAASGPGSHTAQMLASQNMLRQVAGPLGLPESFAESVLAQTAMRPLQWAYKAAEPRVGARVAEAMLDPETAAMLVRSARGFDARRAPTQLDLLLQRSAPGAAGYLSGQAASQ